MSLSADKTMTNSPPRSSENNPYGEISCISYHHRVMHKRAVIKSLTDHTKNIPSSSNERSKERKHVTSELIANGYPKHFVIDGSGQKSSLQQSPTSAQDAEKSLCIYPTSKVKRNPTNGFWTIKSKWLWIIIMIISQTERPCSDQVRGAIYSSQCQDCDKS